MLSKSTGFCEWYDKNIFMCFFGLQCSSLGAGRPSNKSWYLFSAGFLWSIWTIWPNQTVTQKALVPNFSHIYAHVLSWYSWRLLSSATVGTKERLESWRPRHDSLTLKNNACRPDKVGIDSLVDEACLTQVFGGFRRTYDFVWRKPRCCNTQQTQIVV